MKITLTELMIYVIILGLLAIVGVALCTPQPPAPPREQACQAFCQSVSLPHRGIDSLRNGQHVTCVCGHVPD